MGRIYKSKSGSVGSINITFESEVVFFWNMESQQSACVCPCLQLQRQRFSSSSNLWLVKLLQCLLSRHIPCASLNTLPHRKKPERLLLSPELMKVASGSH